ncbi:MAG TPA: hypothetical protein ENJ95_08710 [Bacteroidetes bacterium]|nr:hypothetical protein [Bacteroidota bacterium]
MKKQKNKAIYGTEVLPMTKEMEKECAPLFGKSMQTEKFRRAAKHGFIFIMHETMTKHPSWPLNKTIAETIKSMNPEIPPKLFLEIVAGLVNHWEEKNMKEAVAA